MEAAGAELGVTVDGEGDEAHTANTTHTVHTVRVQDAEDTDEAPPVLDISALLAVRTYSSPSSPSSPSAQLLRDAAKVRQDIAQAATRWGFFHVTGHGIPDTAQTLFLTHMRAFFDQPQQVGVICHCHRIT
jgi:hypothetical protein